MTTHTCYEKQNRPTNNNNLYFASFFQQNKLSSCDLLLDARKQDKTISTTDM